MFPFYAMPEAHREIARRYIGSIGREPDLVVGTDAPYLYRWHVIERNPDANVYFHIQVASDPDRPLHDHPWDNQSVILAGGYEEMVPFQGIGYQNPVSLVRSVGQVITRTATDAHRLVLPSGVPYTMTQFSTGPKLREWGFWTPEGWRPFTECIKEEGGQSRWIADARFL